MRRRSESSAGRTVTAARHEPPAPRITARQRLPNRGKLEVTNDPKPITVVIAAAAMAPAVGAGADAVPPSLAAGRLVLDAWRRRRSATADGRRCLPRAVLSPRSSTPRGTRSSGRRRQVNVAPLLHHRRCRSASGGSCIAKQVLFGGRSARRGRQALSGVICVTPCRSVLIHWDDRQALAN